MKWNLDTNRIDTIQIPGLNALGNTLTYTGIISSNNKVLLLPIAKRQTICVEEENITELSGGYSFVQDDGIRYIYYEKNSGRVTVINKELKTQSEIEIGKVNVNIENILYVNHNLAVECEVVDIRDFVEFVQTME